MPLLTLVLIACELGVYRSYALLLRADAGFLPGASPTHAKQYWEALEQSAALPTAFDERAELLKPPRSKYSALAKGLVLELDHDCPWIGGPVGKGNHVAFLSLLALGDAALLLHVATCVTVQPWGITHPAWHALWRTQIISPFVDNALASAISAWAGQILDRVLGRSALHLDRSSTSSVGVGGVADVAHLPFADDEVAIVRLLGLSEALAIILVLCITPLLVTQLLLIAKNMLAVEDLKWRRENPNARAPRRGDPGWSDYAPYDLGSARRNLLAFVRGTRSSGLESKAV